MTNHTLTPLAHKLRKQPAYMAMVQVTVPNPDGIVPETTVWRASAHQYATKRDAMEKAKMMIAEVPQHFTQKHDREYAAVRQINIERTT